MLDLVIAIFLALISAGIGKRLLEWLGECPEHPSDVAALATPLGLGLLAISCLAIAEAGCLNLVGLSVLLAVATELGALGGARLVRELIQSRKIEKAQAAARTSWPDRLLKLALGITISATAIAALAPVTDGDALCYHLQVPKVFLIRHAAVFSPDLHETIYPLVTEFLYAIALEFRGPVACRCIQWILGLVFAANVAALARPSLGSRAWWAGTFALLVPAVSNGMSAPLNDVALASFGTAAIFAWTRFMDRWSVRSAIVAGIFCGLAIGVKYPALVLAAILVAGILLRPLLRPTASWNDGLTRAFGHAMVFSCATILVGGCWYLRAYVHTGNPVFPFFRDWFGGSGLDVVLDPIKRPLTVTPLSVLTSLFPLTVDPQRFDSFAHQFGPLFLLFLPAIFLEKTPRRVLGLVGLGYLFLMLCMTQRQSMRFLLIAVGPMAIASAYLAMRWAERRTVPARLLTAIVLMVVVFETGIATTRGIRAAQTVLGAESFEHFLRREEPTYRVGTWIHQNLPANARLIGQDHRGFYIPRDYTMELAHRRRTGLGENGETPAQIIETLKAEGYTHLLLCPPTDDSSIEFDPTLTRLLSNWLDLRRPLYHAELADGEGNAREYSIYDLQAVAEPLGALDQEKRTR